MKIEFLPTNYQAPKGPSNYMKLQKGENKFRILSQPIFGWIEWVSNKPMRYRMDAKPTKSHDNQKPLAHFWAFIVWNYLEERIQIYEIPQATIRKPLEALCKDSDWGSPFSYDIKISKTGEGTNTEYMVSPLPHKPVSAAIKLAYEASPCWLEALFEGEEPFSDAWPKLTKGVFADSLDVKPETGLNLEQASALKDSLSQCSSDLNKHVKKYCDSHKYDMSFIGLPMEVAERFNTAVRNEMSKAALQVAS